MFSRNLNFIVIITSVCLLAGCATQASPEQLQLDKTSILDQSALFSKAYVTNDDEALMSVYAQNAVIAPPQRPFISKTDDVKTYWTTPFARNVTAHKATPVDIIIDSNLAYDWGLYEGVAEQDGEPRRFGGKYLIVWKRGSDGTWRIVQDMWN